MLDRIIYWAERVTFPLNKWLSYLAMVVVFIMMLLTVADVIGRKFVGIIPGSQPVPGAYELTEFMLVVTVFAAIGYAQFHDEHISINVLTSRFPKRVQDILDTVIYLISLVLSCLVTYRSVVYAQRIIEQGDVSGVLQIPLYPFVFVVAAGMFMFSLALLVNVIKSLAKAVK
jgi:TRAP-type transport system small permease protein